MIGRSARCFLATVLLCAVVARAEESSGGAAPWGLWGGATLGKGDALWGRAGMGVDVNALANAQFGYAHALDPNVDLGVALQGNWGLADALGGTVKLRLRMLQRDSFHLGVELPLSVDVYPRSRPMLAVVGFEPTLLMSSFLGEHLELFYGGGGRIFAISDVLLGGPQLKAGLAVRFGCFAVFVAGKASYLFTAGRPGLVQGGAELGIAFDLGGAR